MIKVGGEYYHTIIAKHMRKLGRVLVCGSIQTYNEVEQKLCMYFIYFQGLLKSKEFLFKKYCSFYIDSATNVSILMKELTIQGFMCFTWYEKWPTAFVELNKYIQEVIIYSHVNYTNLILSRFHIFNREKSK